MKQIRKRITYANVMSSIAVFLVLGGATAYAAKKIGSNEIKGNSITTGKIKKEAVSASKLKKNSVTTPKIANGAVTGAKLNLGTVGTVPNATHAINADNANNANTVAGNTIRKFFYASNQTAAKTVILSLNGLTLTAGCEGEIPSLIATTSVDHSLIHAGGTYLTATPFYVEEDDFELGDNVDILEEEFDSVQGTLTYAQPSGAVVTATFESEEGGFAGFDTDCVISGDAIG